MRSIWVGGLEALKKSKFYVRRVCNFDVLWLIIFGFFAIAGVFNIILIDGLK